jgi:hypothetical protein
MLYRTIAARIPSPTSEKGAYPSNVSENANVYRSGWNALVCHSLPGSVRSACPAHASSHACSIGSPVSCGTVRLGARSVGQVIATASSSAVTAATVHS